MLHWVCVSPGPTEMPAPPGTAPVHGACCIVMSVYAVQPAFAAPALPLRLRSVERCARATADGGRPRRAFVTCAAAKQPKQPKELKQPKQPKTKGTAADSSRLGSTGVSSSSRSNATLMQAMGDYFGDDGRELDDYAKRPRNAAGKVKLRVLLVGSGKAEAATARELKASGRVRGLYYCPDEGTACDLNMGQLATSSTVRAKGMEEEIVHFCKWACVDCVFAGPDHDGCIGQATEAALAAIGITVFQHDVSAAIAAGTMSVDDCLATISEELDAVAPPGEQLVE